jgi:two-component system chemotaxis response regulator CheB
MVRRLITRILSADKRFDVLGTAGDGDEALLRIAELRPNIVILDLNMPGPDAITTLGCIGEQFPTVQVLMCSSLARHDAPITLEALKAGAIDYVTKPMGMQTVDYASRLFATDLTNKLWQMCERRQASAPAAIAPCDIKAPLAEERQLCTFGPVIESNRTTLNPAPAVLAIGSSTGGPAALSEVLPLLPADFPLAVIIVQHMPANFTRLLAERLSQLCQMPVIEAEQGMEVRPGVMLLAPGDFHLELVRKLHRVEVNLTRREPVNSCRPSVDVLFRSVAEIYGGAAIGAVLTGMGQDGLRGARALKACGAPVLVQDRATSVVWGMPGAIAEAGLADTVLPLGDIIPRILTLVALRQSWNL